MTKMVTVVLQHLYADDDTELTSALDGWSVGGWTLVSGTVQDYVVRVHQENEMENQGGETEQSGTFLQPKITGYRQLSQSEADLINEGKALAEQVGAWVAKLRQHPNIGGPEPTGDALSPLDQRWISIGATDLQRGFMAVIRGIAQPTTF